jgi:hypothetical protein
MSISSNAIAGIENCAGNVMVIVELATIPFGDINAMVWFETTPGAETDSVSLANVIDAASAKWKRDGSPVLQRNTASPTIIATACRVLTVLAV